MHRAILYRKERWSHCGFLSVTVQLVHSWASHLVSAYFECGELGSAEEILGVLISALLLETNFLQKI